jgi:hypothetical protein
MRNLFSRPIQILLFLTVVIGLFYGGFEYYTQASDPRKHSAEELMEKSLDASEHLFRQIHARFEQNTLHLAGQIRGALSVSALLSRFDRGRVGQPGEERDAERLLAGLAAALDDAGLTGVCFGVSSSLDQFAIGSGLGPAELAADSARRTGQSVAWFRDLALGPVLADAAVRDRVQVVARPVLQALAGAPGQVTIPALKNLSEADARARLEELNLTVSGTEGVDPATITQIA